MLNIEPFRPEGEPRAIFWVILRVCRDIDLSGTQESWRFGNADCSLVWVVMTSTLLPSRDIPNPSGALQNNINGCVPIHLVVILRVDYRNCVPTSIASTVDFSRVTEGVRSVCIPSLWPFIEVLTQLAKLVVYHGF